MPIWFFASIVEILDKIPISEKSNTPWILNPFQPSSLSVVFAGTFSVLQTRDISSSSPCIYIIAIIIPHNKLGSNPSIIPMQDCTK